MKFLSFKVLFSTFIEIEFKSENIQTKKDLN